MEHNQRGILGCFGCQSGNPIAQIALQQTGRISLRNSQSCPEPLGPVGLFWPDQGFQPCHLLCVRKVEGIEVQPRPPEYARNGVWQWRIAACPTRKYRCVSRCLIGPHAVVAETVGITVRQQAKAGRSTNLDESERLGQARKNRQEGSAAPGLVGLSRVAEHCRPDFRPARKHDATEGWPVLRGAADKPDSSKQQIGLTFGWRHLGEKPQQIRVLCDAVGEFLILCRSASRFLFRETMVSSRNWAVVMLWHARCVTSILRRQEAQWAFMRFPGSVVKAGPTRQRIEDVSPVTGEIWGQLIQINDDFQSNSFVRIRPDIRGPAAQEGCIRCQLNC